MLQCMSHTNIIHNKINLSCVSHDLVRMYRQARIMMKD
jgi:hypothetical protein